MIWNLETLNKQANDFKRISEGKLKVVEEEVWNKIRQQMASAKVELRKVAKIVLDQSETVQVI